MKRPSYKDAIKWIVNEDDTSWKNDIDELSGIVSIALVADLFGVSSKKVATDVYNQTYELKGKDRVKYSDLSS